MVASADSSSNPSVTYAQAVNADTMNPNAPEFVPLLQQQQLHYHQTQADAALSEVKHAVNASVHRAVNSLPPTSNGDLDENKPTTVPLNGNSPASSSSSSSCSVSSSSSSSSSSPSPLNTVSRVAALPMVLEARAVVSDAVNTLAGKNKYARYAVETTNNAVQTLMVTAARISEPYQEKFSPQISKVDAMGAHILDAVEDKFPVVAQPSARALSNALGAASELKSKITSTAPVASASQALKTLDAAMASILDNMETVVDKYLPEETAEEHELDGSKHAGSSSNALGTQRTQPRGPVKRAVALSKDIRRRSTRKLNGQVKHMQAALPEVTRKLKETSPLVGAVSRSAQSVQERLASLIAYLQLRASQLKEACIEQAKALDAEWELRARLDTLITRLLDEISSIAHYLQRHFPILKQIGPLPDRAALIDDNVAAVNEGKERSMEEIVSDLDITEADRA